MCASNKSANLLLLNAPAYSAIRAECSGKILFSLSLGNNVNKDCRSFKLNCLNSSGVVLSLNFFKSSGRFSRLLKCSYKDFKTI